MLSARAQTRKKGRLPTDRKFYQLQVFLDHNKCSSAMLFSPNRCRADPELNSKHTLAFREESGLSHAQFEARFAIDWIVELYRINHFVSIQFILPKRFTVQSPCSCFSTRQQVVDPCACGKSVAGLSHLTPFDEVIGLKVKSRCSRPAQNGSAKAFVISDILFSHSFPHLKTTRSSDPDSQEISSLEKK